MINLEVLLMENNTQIKFKDLTREFVEDFISKMPKEDKRKLKQFIEDNPKQSSSALFTSVKSYIYNLYFRTKPSQMNKRNTFADIIDSLLEDVADDESEN